MVGESHSVIKENEMKKIKGFLKELFIDGLSGMALGLFATLIIGTIISQIGGWIPGIIGTYCTMIGKMAMLMTGAGIGCGVAVKFKSAPLVMVSASVAGLIGAYASQILAGTILVEGLYHIKAPGEPLGAFIAAVLAIYAGRLVSGKTKLDILLTPLVCVIIGGAVGLLVGPPISGLLAKIGEFIEMGTQQAPILMGIIVSVLMGIALTLPISSAALGVILNLSGIAAGAATIGCCANMVGFAVASFKDNKWNGLFAQGLGTSMLQMPNIVKKPIIWLPAIITSAILGPISTKLLGMTNSASGSGMGTSGLVGPIQTYATMVAEGAEPGIVILEIALMQFILPGLLAWGITVAMRKLKWIKPGDMKLDA